MKKSLFVGLLAAAIMAISFTGCKNPDLGSKPVVQEAFFITSDVSSGTSWTTVKNLETKSITLANGAVFAIKVQDDDQDILRVNFAPVRNFDVYNGWKYNNPVPSNSDTLYDTGEVDFDDFDTDALALFKNTSTIYVRAIDAKGNISDIYEIKGMNIN